MVNGAINSNIFLISNLAIKITKYKILKMKKPVNPISPIVAYNSRKV